jgi:hypothetical protein
MGPVLSFLRQLDQDPLQIALLGSLGFLLHSLHKQEGMEGTQVICSSSMHFMVVRRAASMVGLEESAVTKLPARVIRAANTADMVKALAETVIMGTINNVVDGATIMATDNQILVDSIR